MAFDIGSIVARVKADTSQFKAGLGKAQAQAGGFGGKMGKIGAAGKLAFAAVGVAAAAAAAIIVKKAVGAAASFEDKMANISTLMSGDSTEAVNTLSDGILNLTRSIPKSADELGAASYDILSAGVQGSAQQLKVLEESGKLAVAGLGDTGGAVDLMTSSINAFGLDAAEAEKISDVLFKTVKNGKTTVDQLRTGFGAVAPAAASAGVSFEETMAAVSAMTTTGLPANEAYTQLKATFKELIKPGSDLEAALEKAGISNAKAALESEGLGGVLNKLKDSVGGNTSELSKMFGSAEAGAAAISLTDTTAEAFGNTLDDMKNGANAVDEAFEKQQKTFNNTKKRLGNLINEGFIKLGNKILPHLSKALESTINFFSNFRENVTSLGNKVKTFLQPVIDMLWPSFQALFNTLRNEAIPAFISLGQSLKKLWDFVAPVLVPILKVVAMVLGGLIVASIWAMINASNVAWKVLSFGIKVFSWLLDKGKFVFVAMLAPFLAFIIAVKYGFTTVRNFFANNMDKIKAIFRAGVEFIKKYFSWAFETVKAVWRNIIGFYSGIIRGIINAVRSVISGIGNIFTDAYTGVTRMWGQVIDFFGNIVSGIGSALSGVGEAIMSPFRKAFDWIGDKANWAKDQLNKINPFNRNSPSLIDWIKRGTKVIKNEWGGTLGSLATGANQFRNDAQRTITSAPIQVANGARAGAAGGGNVTINLSGIAARSRADLREVGKDIIEAIDEERTAQNKNRILS